MLKIENLKCPRCRFLDFHHLQEKKSKRASVRTEVRADAYLGLIVDYWEGQTVACYSSTSTNVLINIDKAEYE